jgi:hypothetical protein
MSDESFEPRLKSVEHDRTLHSDALFGKYDQKTGQTTNGLIRNVRDVKAKVERIEVGVEKLQDSSDRGELQSSKWKWWLAGAVAATTTFVTIAEILVKWFKL